MLTECKHSASKKRRSLPFHLKTPEQFQIVMKAGVVAQSPHFAMHWLFLAKAGEASGQFRESVAWVGVVLPKRHAKKAVRRNMLRRQIYSVGMEFQEQLEGAAHVLRLKKGFEDEGFVSASSEALKKAVRTELKDLFARALARLAKD
jgi:ribonuclease P protein component